MFPIGCCSICFDPLTAAASTDSVDGVSAAACGHVFHTNCVAKWTAASNGDCPQCRQKISGGSLRRLFLVQDGNGGQASSAPPSVDVESGKKKNMSHEDEEQRIVQDVLQSELHDLHQEICKLRKSLEAMEDALEEKVLEATRLEAQHASRDNGVEELRTTNLSIQSAFATVEKENSELREQAYILRQENRNAELQVRERDEKLREANEQITLLTREAEVSERATADLQRQLEAAHRLDYSSVYESVDNLDMDRLASATPSQNELGGQHAKWKKLFWSRTVRAGDCLKKCFIVGALVLVLLGLLVALPLKIIFSEKAPIGD